MSISFYLLLVAQAVSLVGTHVTGFSLSVWMYQETGSITLYGAVLLSSIIAASSLARLHRPLVGLDDAPEPPEPVAPGPVAADAIGEP